MVSQLIVQPLNGQPTLPTPGLRVALTTPDDEEIALSRIALASVSRGQTRVALASLSGSVRAFLDGLSVLGVEHQWEPSKQELVVVGTGLDGLRAPSLSLDVRGEAAVAALLMGICVSRPFVVEFWVDQVVLDLLVPILQGAHVVQTGAELLGGGHSIRLMPGVGERSRGAGITVRDHGLFSWIKQAVLLAGLRANSATVFEEQFATSDHLERALLRARAPLDGQGTCITLHPPRDPDALAPQIYQRISSAQLAVPLLVAALAFPGGELELRDISLNPSRTSVVALLRAAGLDARTVAEGDRQGEPVGRILLGWGAPAGTGATQLRGQNICGESAFRLGDEMIYLAALATSRTSDWTFANFLPQTRSGDTQLWPRARGLLRSAGVAVDEHDGAWAVQSCTDSLRPLRVTTGGDGRLALLATTLALRASGPSVIDDVECLRQIYPKWIGTLRALGAKVELRNVPD